MPTAKAKKTKVKQFKKALTKVKPPKANVVKAKKGKSGAAIGSICKKVSYSTGFICAKVSKVKKIAEKKNWDKPLSEMNDLLRKASKTTASLLEKAKDSAGDLKESFIAGYESKQHQSGPKTKKRAKNIEEQKINLPEESPEVAASVEESPNEELEKEIEQINKSVPEV